MRSESREQIGSTRKMNFGRAGASLAIKVVFGLAIAAAAAAVATEVAITGSVNPAGWGRQVNQACSTAKDRANRFSCTKKVNAAQKTAMAPSGYS